MIRQPASLTLWTYLEIQDADRIATLLARSARYEEAGLHAVAAWNGKEFQKLERDFRRTLAQSPDPVSDDVAPGLVVRPDGYWPTLGDVG